MALNGLPDWSTTAISNTDMSAISLQENVTKPSDVNGFERAHMAQVASWLRDLGGTATVSGTNTLTVTLNEAFTALYNGQVLAIKAANANTGAVTLNPTPSGGVALGAKAIRLQGDSALVGAEMAANGVYLLRYDTAYNSAAGAWVLLNPAVTAVSNASTSTPGIVQLATPAQVVAGTSATLAVTPAGFYFEQGYIYGLAIANNGVTPASKIDVAVGNCRDRAHTGNIVLATALTAKDLASGWAVGSSAGLLDQGSVGNGTYHVHAIERTDTGVVDVIASLSHDLPSTITLTIASPGVVTWGVAGAGHGLVAGSPFKFSTTGALPTGVTAGTQYYVIATGLAETTFQFAATNGGSAINTTGSQSGVQTGLPGPQMPTNYTLFRRIGSIVRAGGSLKAFHQIARQFIFDTPVADVTSVNPGTSAVTRTLTVPVGIIVETLLAIGTLNASSNFLVYFSMMISADVAASNANAQIQGTGAQNIGGYLRVWSNTSAQIRSRQNISAAGDTTYINTLGWSDPAL